MELNEIEFELKDLYDNWRLGNEKENNGYSSMFRMGFPDEYINSGKPLLMYVGQECRDCKPYKTQFWIREFQNAQRTKAYNEKINEGAANYPFWNFYRRLCGMGCDVLWNNLDKLHLDSEDQKKQPLPSRDAVLFNSAYGEDGLSILQREIKLLNPKVIVLAIGKGKYTASLASAFSVSEEDLKKYEPSPQNYVSEISSVLGLDNTAVFWTYHPRALQQNIKKVDPTLSVIEKTINNIPND